MCSPVYLALLQVMRDDLLRRSEAAALPWGCLKVHQGSSGRLNVVNFKTDQEGKDNWLFLGPETTRNADDPAGLLPLRRLWLGCRHNLA